MTVIVCISDGGGMMFNKRRQSRDAAVIENIAQLVGDGAVFISDFSINLFSDSTLSVIAASDPLAAADKEDFVFIEDRGIKNYIPKITRLVIYRWNRSYPADIKLDIDAASLGMKLTHSIDFKGKSHEKITREIWKW